MKNRYNKPFNAAISYSITFCMLLVPVTSFANPSGGQVGSGNADISQAGLVTTINQSSQNASINWDSFNVNENETVNFVQPNSNSTTLNHIHDANPSTILGSINANGRVFLSNSNGFIFGANSLINVGSLFATTSEISDLSDSKLNLSNGGQGSILNEGTINTQSGGYVAFFAPNIENSGALNSPEGNITLSNANSGTLYLPNSAGIGFTIDSLSSLNPIGIENTGEIKANGGQVLLSSAAIDSTLRSAINNEGIIDVSSLQQNGGEIRILASAGSITQAGSLNADAVNNGDGGDIIMIAQKDMIHSGTSSARGGDTSGDGGFVETSGHENLDLNFQIDTRALNGEWGTWLIDPTTLDVGDGTAMDSAAIMAGLDLNGGIIFLADTINVNGNITTTPLGGDDNVSLTFTATDLNINNDITTDNVNLNSTNIFLNSNAKITARGEMTFKDDTNLLINGASTLTVTGTGALSLNGAVISGADANDSLTITTQNGKIDLRRMLMTQNARLDAFTINRTTVDASDANNENITLSGNIYADTLIINNTTSARDQNINLASNTLISGDDIIFTNTNINGSNSNLTINGSSTVSLHKVDGIAALDVNAPTLTLTDDISTQGDGISLSGGNIDLNKSSGTLNLITYNTGNLTISSAINSTAQNNLDIEATDGAINLSTINNVNNLTITNSSSLTTLNGDLSIGGDFVTSASTINLVGNRTLTAAGNINIKDTEFTTDNPASTIIINALTDNTAIKIGDFTSGSLTVNSKALHLNGEISTSKETTNSLNLSNSGAISLESDSVLSGNLYLGATGSEIAINSLSSTELRNLEINYDNHDIIFGDIGKDIALQSFILNGTGKVTLASTKSFSINTAGNAGVSFLGNLTMDLIDELTIDTSENSGSGGDINLSGLNINGEFAVNLKAGSGNISLGTIGDSAAVKTLSVVNTGNIELYGNINNVENMFDFSNASSVILNDNITFGNSELYLTSLLFGDASINGNYDLTIYASALTIGEIGQNIALQNLTINTFDQAITIGSDINTAGNIIMNGGSFDLDSKIISTGGEINLTSLTNIKMSAATELSATDSDIILVATAGDVSVAKLSALNNVNITATAGNIFNAIDDYSSNTSTSTNITADSVTLNASANIGASVDSPIVVDAGKDGNINLTAGGEVYIANLSNSATSSNSDIFDNSLLTASANADILSQLKPESFNATQFTLLEISDPSWQLDQLDNDFDSSNSSPRIYYSKKGWRLGNPK